MDKSADLRQWFKARWVDISRKNPDGSHPPCGRDDADKGAYPKCRPARAAARMTKKQKAYAVRAKRSKPQGVGGKPTMVATFKKKAMFNPEIDSILESLEKGAMTAAGGVAKTMAKAVPAAAKAAPKKGLMERAGAAVGKFTSGGAGATAKRVGTAITKNPVKSALIAGGVAGAANAMRRPAINPQTGQPTSSGLGRAAAAGVGVGTAAYGANRLMRKMGQASEAILDSLEKEASKAMRATLKKNVSRPHASERDHKHTTLAELPSRAGVLAGLADPTGASTLANLVGTNVGAIHEGLRARKGKSEYHPTDRAKSVRNDMKTVKGRLRRAAHVLPGVAGYQLGRDLVRRPQENAMYKAQDEQKGQKGDLQKKASAEVASILDTLEKEARALPKAHKLEAKMHKARAAQHGAAAKRLHPGLLTRMMGMNTPERRNALKDIEAKSGAKADNIQAQLDLAKAQRNLKTTERLGRNAGKRS